MISFNDYQKKRVLVEFNGPAGQPDPSGISAPSLTPRFPSAPVSTMGTQPGMSMEMPKSDPYQDFVDHLATMSRYQIFQTIQKLEGDIDMIIQSK